MNSAIQNKVNIWQSDDYDLETREEIIRLQNNNPQELIESFYKNLEFGTGGLRGIMGVGTNRMNRYTVGSATQGLANYLLKCFKNEKLRVAISYDSRIHSREFAEIAAAVLSANQIYVFLFSDLRPTPELSFAVRHLNCHAGIMITASHNPKEYNGYKVYWQDGGQLVPPHDLNVIKEVNKISAVNQVKWQANSKFIKKIGQEIDNAYLEEVLALQINSPSNSKAKNLKIVYTPLHGTGITLIPKALEMFGFKNVYIVESQAVTDGSFPTVKSPNPEEKSALALALKKAEEVDADLILATDPDADRVGIAVRNGNGEMQLLNGNQTGTLLFYYVLSQYQQHNRLSEESYVVKTIVTTDLIKRIAIDFNVECQDVLTGFKYITETIRTMGDDRHFVIGGEESYGYLIGDFVRDKDSISACCMIAEMTAYYLANGTLKHKLLPEILTDIYHTFGYYKEDLLSITKIGKEGLEEIQKMMDNYRSNPPKTLGGQPVVLMKDYEFHKYYNFEHHSNGILDLPTSNVLQFFTADNSKITIRPSGTEPKIKFYFSVVEPLKKRDSVLETERTLNQRIEKLKKDILQNQKQ